ncbi:MAG: hypothetical protein Q7S52_02740 [bacterium]|nr:hypothetical protein [bacterium]
MIQRNHIAATVDFTKSCRVTSIETWHMAAMLPHDGVATPRLPIVH